jgi:hypothetical protein
MGCYRKYGQDSWTKNHAADGSRMSASTSSCGSPIRLPSSHSSSVTEPGAERAVTWSTDRGYRHFRVDAGEDTPMRNLTPILVADGSFPKERVVGRFSRASDRLDPASRTFVLERLQEYPA